MRSLRRSAGLAAAAGLAGSLFLAPSATAPASARTPAAAAVRVPAVPAAVPAGRVRPHGAEPDRSPCLGLVPPPYAFAVRTPFVCGDWRLGPAELPRTGVLGSILAGYRRLGGLTPVEFLNRWWDPSRDLGRGDWRYPPDDGFEHDAGGHVIAAPLTLHPGRLLDRFGNEFGSFLAPAGAKYGERSIPPSNLDTEDARYPYNYHLYRVKKDTTVCAGPAAPAFEQPGQGVQFVTSSSFCPTLPAGVSVNSLLRSGNLERAN
ncbi:TNT domain-containing protein [Streptacidiphilus sp. ASG 303]|uniref:TNT domain-containing protein n=1 Tax=Streptomycetaceae TaxID=2062 RepID=UPI001E5B720A|nr:TNT domain-containing protein [Streptacidiphilus sp. ASG 303]MCD0485316.1 TNT domain-containing protein [Streptacidiphilus sp. ASG 303]